MANEQYEQIIEQVIAQEKKLTFKHFSNDDAYTLGNIIYNLAKERELPVTIEVRKNTQIVYHVALEGTAPDNDMWLERKARLVTRVHKSSYRVGLELKLNDTTLEKMCELSSLEYAAHGGCFPITIEGTGIIGSVAVSGLEQSKDHALVTEGIEKFLSL